MTPPGVPAREQPIVHLVEDDELSRTASVRLLQTAGYAVKAYANAGEFLASPPTEAGCLVLDLRLPGLSGLALQERLAGTDNPLPIVFLTGHGDIPKSVQAMKAGAVDFLTKPVNGQVLLDAVARAIARDGDERAIRTRLREARARYERLTPREREVLAHVIAGQLNKQIAFDLGTTEQTIKVHRGRVMEKLGANSAADLARIAAELGVKPFGRAP
jgi:FixJ family two-component response regulator